MKILGQSSSAPVSQALPDPLKLRSGIVGYSSKDSLAPIVKGGSGKPKKIWVVFKKLFWKLCQTLSNKLSPLMIWVKTHLLDKLGPLFDGFTTHILPLIYNKAQERRSDEIDVLDNLSESLQALYLNKDHPLSLEQEMDNLSSDLREKIAFEVETLVEKGFGDLSAADQKKKTKRAMCDLGVQMSSEEGGAELPVLIQGVMLLVKKLQLQEVYF